VEAAFQAQKQEQVNLVHEIPVLMFYGTAIAKEDGQVSFSKTSTGTTKLWLNCSPKPTRQNTASLGHPSATVNFS
jgi:hypothetical protein